MSSLFLTSVESYLPYLDNVRVGMEGVVDGSGLGRDPPALRTSKGLTDSDLQELATKFIFIGHHTYLS